MEFVSNGAALNNKFKGGYEKIDKEKVFSAIVKK